MTIHQILTKYWGYSSFRPLQEDIINTALKGKDSLALLPTGGGKSLCYQVPALAKDGLCLVISPLIALMKDQVENLRARGIRASYIISGMSRDEIDVLLDNCVYGKIKLLYISPERLASEIVQVRIKKMEVNLVAVDEAHCISEWGYDFRPSYLEISSLRELCPNVPFLALTATATPDVVEDIQDKLRFEKHHVLKKSFERKNLAYMVLQEEDKKSRLIKILNNVKGTAIVYARTRKKTKDICNFLLQKGIRAGYYHGGLDKDRRAEAQENWMKDKTRVIVSTNAFGMGIDKPEVRVVVHVDIPDNLESYFQEAGRAGRDEKKAYAVLLFNESDKAELEQRYKMAFPKMEMIKKVYNALGNYFQLAVGTGENLTFNFDISTFCSQYQFKILDVYNSLKFLEKENYVQLTESFYSPSKIHMQVDNRELYRFEVANQPYEKLIKTLLRSYGGVFDDYVKISESEIAKRTGLSLIDIVKQLKQLDKQNILSYDPQKDMPQLTYLTPRTDIRYLRISKDTYGKRKKIFKTKMEAMLNYASRETKCRSQMLLAYFGEDNSRRCGVCDVCLKRNQLDLSDLEFETVAQQIKALLKAGPARMEDIVPEIKNSQEDKIIKVYQWLMDNGKIVEVEDGKMGWK